MKIYQVTNRVTGQGPVVVYADFPWLACEVTGWPSRDCDVQGFDSPHIPGQASLPTPEERDFIGKCLNEGIENLDTLEQTRLLGLLRRWFDAQDWSE